jgi:PAS domain S-box-containing protein
MNSPEMPDRGSLRSRLETLIAGLLDLHVKNISDIQPAHLVSALMFIFIPAMIIVATWDWLFIGTRFWLSGVTVALLIAYFLNRRGKVNLAATIASLSISSIPVSSIYLAPDRTPYTLLLSLIWIPIVLIAVFLVARTWLFAIVCGVINAGLLLLLVIYPSLANDIIIFTAVYFVIIQGLLIIAAIRRDFVIRAMDRHVRAIEEEKKRFELLFEATFETIIIHRDGVILDVNQAAQRMFGYQREEVIGRHLSEFVPPQYHSTMLTPIAETMEAAYQAQAICKDGSLRWVETRSRPLWYRNEWVRLIAVRDIDERIRAEEQRIELAVERERVGVLQRFLGNMSHDLRTPLSVIKTAAYLIDKLGDQPEKLQRQIEVLHAQTDQLQRMLDDLLQMSRLDKADTSSYQFAWQSVNPLLQEVYEETHSAALRKNIELRFTMDDSLPKVLLDQSEFKRMIKHLVNNAIAYTPESGHVQVSAFARRPPEFERNWVVIEVRDTGVGISPLELPHVFERFYRVDPARTGATGTGLGLNIARKIAEAHNGRIEAESQLGKGSTFRVSLPALAEHSPETEQAEQRQPNARESHG